MITPRSLLIAGLVSFAELASQASVASADPKWTDWAVIANLEGGWAADTLTVRHSAPFTNPAGCSVTTVGYATDPTDTGRALFHAMALSAFMNRKEVALLLNGCVFDKPRIIAVSIR
jgi:hypothetical protein